MAVGWAVAVAAASAEGARGRREGVATIGRGRGDKERALFLAYLEIVGLVLQETIRRVLIDLDSSFPSKTILFPK